MNVAVGNFPRSGITVTHPDGELVRATVEIVHVHGETYSAAPRNPRRAGKFRMIAGYHERIDVTTFEANAGSRVVVVEKVV